MKKKLIVAALGMALAGPTAAQNTQGESASPTSVERLARCEGERGRLVSRTAISSPKLEEEHSVEVGQGMVATFNRDVYEGGLRLLEPLTFRGKYLLVRFDVSYPVGFLKPQAVPAGPAYYSPDYVFKFASEPRPRSVGRADVNLATDPTNPHGLIAHVSHGGIRQVYPIVDAKFSMGNCWDISENSFRRELIYTGVAQGTISLEYREFVNDMARPAFSQTLRYDLNEGRTIGFRGARFEILDANNVSVRYRVLRELE